jgi:phenylpropionate dioxygenase-like ring-hydroxylating dioxygenase large terminal subunit
MMSKPLVPTLGGDCYRDPQQLARELECIFARQWLLVGREERLAAPGDYLTQRVGSESVLVVRGREGALRAFYNVCRHRGSELCAAEAGRFEAGIRCPYHAWTYALDGRLRGVPRLRDVEDFPKHELSLYPVSLATWEGFLFIRLEQEGAELLDCLGALPARAHPYPLAELRTAVRAERIVEANWKILVENFMECYHCPGVHPELCDLVPLYRSGDVDASDDAPPEFRDGAVTATRSGTTRRPIVAGLRDRARQQYHAELVLPNLLLYLFPDYVCTRTLWPLTPTRTRIVSEWLFEAETTARGDFDPSDAVEFMNLLGGQDWAVCEGVQRGVTSRAHRNGFLLPQESEVADVMCWICAQLGAA